MKLFQLDENYTVVCEFKSTRSGFKHEATLLNNGYEKTKTKICYLNRTWEHYEYETVLEKVINGYFSGTEKEKYLKVIATFS